MWETRKSLFRIQVKKKKRKAYETCVFLFDAHLSRVPKTTSSDQAQLAGNAIVASSASNEVSLQSPSQSQESHSYAHATLRFTTRSLSR